MADKSLSRAVRKEILAAVRDRYVRSTKIEKGAILKRVRSPYRLQPQLCDPIATGNIRDRTGSACPILKPHLRRGRQGVLDRPLGGSRSDLRQTIASDIAQPDRIAGRSRPPAA